ncbi:MAG TPA: hypothetical protein VFQ79_12520 [Bryobacteraceae bacterium]|nr:hypothetical protein [Bryobacteraceae bacterium]
MALLLSDVNNKNAGRPVYFLVSFFPVFGDLPESSNEETCTPIFRHNLIAGER